MSEENKDLDDRIEEAMNTLDRDINRFLAIMFALLMGAGLSGILIWAGITTGQPFKAILFGFPLPIMLYAMYATWTQYEDLSELRITHFWSK